MAANKIKQIGINNHKTKLSDAQVLDIRKRASEGSVALSKEFGVAYNTIRMIINRQRRKLI